MNMKLLLTNDDGYKAAGIRALHKEFHKQYDLFAVAPAHEQSWVSKSISRHTALTARKVRYQEFDGFCVDGTPADCAQIGIFRLSDGLPEIVVSGINVGSNLGYEEILSSGTVGAALEASLQKIPAFASSINYQSKVDGPMDFSSSEAIEHFKVAAEITRKIIDRVMSAGFPQNTHVISINMPWNVTPDAPWVVTRPHDSAHEELFESIGDNQFKHRGGVGLREVAADDSDLMAIKDGYVSILPINIQLTSEFNQHDLAKKLEIPIFKP